MYFSPSQGHQVAAFLARGKISSIRTVSARFSRAFYAVGILILHAYIADFHTLVHVTTYINLVSVIVCGFLLISFLVLPVEYTHRHYLSVCTAFSILLLQVWNIIVPRRGLVTYSIVYRCPSLYRLGAPTPNAMTGSLPMTCIPALTVPFRVPLCSVEAGAQ